MLDEYKITNTEEGINSVIDRINKENIYSDFVTKQEKGFMKFIQYVNTMVYLLQQKAYVSPYIEIRARIKDTESALKNYENSRMLDDVFGIEIICVNEEEIDIIKNTLEKTFFSTKSKVYGPHNRTNGYNAKHESYSANKENKDAKKWKLCEETVPLVECQFKTMQVALNPDASHNKYKKIDKEKTQEVLEKTVLEIGKQLPKMWVSREGRIEELSYKQIVQRVYPFVDLTRIKEPKPKNKSKE